MPRGLRQPPGLKALGCQGSVRDRLRLPDRLRAFRPRVVILYRCAGEVGALRALFLYAAVAAPPTVSPVHYPPPERSEHNPSIQPAAPAAPLPSPSGIPVSTAIDSPYFLRSAKVTWCWSIYRAIRRAVCSGWQLVVLMTRSTRSLHLAHFRSICRT